MFATIFFTLAACSGDNNSQTPSAYKTTVLVYMEGTNLETDGVAASKNIGEMLAANYSPDVAIVLATGAANKGSSGWVSSWKTVKYHVVRNASLEEKADLGNVDMGKPEQLTNFIEWGQKYYAADRYILVFWDHGGGTLGGFGGYSTAKPPGGFPTTSGLSVSQLRDVVRANVAKTGKKFEVIGFDACLMGTLEIANSFTGSANYLVASQDIEAGAGWDWTAMLNFIVANPNTNGASIGTAIAKSFYAKLERTDSEEDKASETATISVIDLEKIKPLNEALAAFSVWQQKVLTDGGTHAWYELAYARASTMDFYTSDLDLSGSGDTVDILDLIDNIQTMNPDNITTDDDLMFEQLKKAVQNAVVYNQVGTKRVYASGLSMMFPTYTVWSNGDSGTLFDNLAVYKDIAPDTLYSALIADYSKRARTIAPITIVANPVENGSAITATISNMNLYYWYEMAYIAMTSTVTTDGKEYNYYSGHQPIWPKTNSTTLSYVWDEKWMTLSGKIVSVMADPVLPNPSKPSVLRLRIPLQYKEQSGFYYLDYDIVKNEVDQHLGFMGDLNKQASRGFAKLERGMKVTALQSLRVANDQFPFNNWVAETDTFTLDWSDEQGGPTFARTALPAETYKLAFTLYDLTMRPSYSATTISKTIAPPPAAP